MRESAVVALSNWRIPKEHRTPKRRFSFLKGSSTPQFTINVPRAHLIILTEASSDSVKAIQWLMKDKKTRETIVITEDYTLVPQMRLNTTFPRTNTWKGRRRVP